MHRLIAICSLHIQQWLGAPLYWFNRTWADSWQNLVKKSAALLVLGLSQWRVPVTALITGDSSVEGQIRRTSEGKVIMDFPNRMVLIANHQVCMSNNIPAVMQVNNANDLSYTRTGLPFGGPLILQAITAICS